ncbi:ATP-binding protein [Mycobacterium deserti]|uniref:AAA family ATPase n=1 Tax=Mycobacterium deserti TaxID=2978347 RepID=A0ABT2MAV4_9MYCO|nr:adenylate/guanylate cyclase domain-containing protein [Mycobacterium deserti]MCT7658126.1 AAA family ATPase [Mycobacterium deserti]
MTEPTVDELLDHAVQALNRGDRARAKQLAKKVLAVDRGNPEAEDLLAAPAGRNELRRLTMMFADIVDSTALSTRIEPEVYRTVIGRYRDQVREIVDRYEGHIFSTKGDGLLVVFGHPRAHENDVLRAVQAGLDITREVARLSERVKKRFGFEISVRVGIHRGTVYLDTGQDDVYGLGANLASRVSGLAPPGTVVISKAIEALVRDSFDLADRPAQPVKGIEGDIEHYQVLGERISPSRVPIGPLVGRDEELAYLTTSWEQAQVGGLTTTGVAFCGEAGMGKSRLATAAALLATQSGAPVVALHGSVFHADAGLHPVRRLLENRCGIDRTTEQSQRLRLLEAEVRDVGLDPETALSLLAPVLGIAAEHGYTPIAAQGAKLYEQISAAIAEYLLACFRDSAGVLLIEDLHWFDASTIDVVNALVDLRSPRLLIVMTSREAASIPRATSVKWFDLSPLTAQQTETLVGALDADLSIIERATIARRCDGVPLYIEEVVTKIREQPTDTARWESVPDTLYEALFARLRTSDNAIPVVQAAATIGRDFDRNLLSLIVDITDEDFDAAIRELEDAMVFEKSGPNQWRFRHELLREVAYELPPPSVRRSLHAGVADALVGTSGEDASDWRLVAFHYDKADRVEDAAMAYQLAAADARRRGALEESRRNLTNALAQIDRQAPGLARDRKEVRLRLRRGFLASAAEGTASPQAAADFERCVELTKSELRPEDLFAALTALWAYYLPRGDIHRALEMSQNVGGVIADVGDWFVPHGQAGFGMVLWYRGDFGTARGLLEDSVAALSDLDVDILDAVWFVPNEPVASTHTHLALARAVQGDLAGADVEFAEARRRAETLSFPQGPFSLAYSQCYEVWARLEAGQFDHVATIIGEMAANAEQHGFDSFGFIATTEGAAAAALSAVAHDTVEATELQGHIATMTMLVDAWRAAESKLFVTFYDGVLAQLLIAADHMDQARERIAIALKLAEETDAKFYHAELLRLRAKTANDDESRASDLVEAITVARKQRALIFELRAAIDDFELRGDDARRVLVDAVDRFADGSAWPELARARTLLG